MCTGKLKRMIAVMLAGIGAAGSGMAGQLDDFEEKAGEPKPKVVPAKPRGHRSSYADRPFGSGTYPSEPGGASFLGSFWLWLVASPLNYRIDDPSAAMLAEEGAYAGRADGLSAWNSWHEPGAPTLPWLRVDGHWQYIDSNLDAVDVRLEAGYNMLGVHARHTRYTESQPTDHLDIDQLYGVIRIGSSGLPREALLHGWEFGLGLGAVQQRGNRDYSSAAVTVPLKLYPADWFGIEFRPAWYRPQERTISDLDLSASLGGRYLQLRGGYRWLLLQGQGTFLDGPYAGLSVSF